MEKFLNCFVVCTITMFVLFPVTGLIMADYYAKHPEPKPKVAILKENSLGCKKILFKNDIFWTCPDSVLQDHAK